MLRKITENDSLKFHNLSPEEKTKRGILGRLSGPVASFIAPTRNGRKYTDDLWQKAFENDLVKEMFANGGLPGELDHPSDRDETDSTKIAIMMPEVPKQDKNGHLIAYVDILDTPCGKIAYQLAKYGFKFGISSRGQGELIEEYDGTESVDPESYTLTAFDLVLLPACEDARLTFTESLTPRRETNFKKALKEALDTASKEDREIMEETLNNLNIKIKEDKAEISDTEQVEEKLSANDPDKSAIRQELFELLYSLMKDIPDCDESDLQDAFRKALRDASEQLYDEKAMDEYSDSVDENLTEDASDVTTNYIKVLGFIKSLLDQGRISREEYNKALHENLEKAVSELDDKDITEEVKQECNNPEDCADREEDKVVEESIEVEDNESNNMIEQLQDTLKANKDLEERVMNLQDQLAVRDAEVKTVNEELDRYKDMSIKLSTLAKNSKKAEKEVLNLSESLAKKDKELHEVKSQKLTESANKNLQVKKLKEELSTKTSQIEKLNEELSELNESISDLKADSELKNSEYNSRITKAKSLIKEYKALANETVNRYIESKARMIGVKPEEISNRLAEKYSVDDIDAICEDLMSYQVNINSLPFSITKKTKVKVTESKKDPLKMKSYYDDEIDDDLLELARYM